MTYELLIQEYTDKLLNKLSKEIKNRPRTYGFEYEFISESPLNPDLMEKLYEFLPECGFNLQGIFFLHENGMHITFEPGGQIEFNSTPLLPDDSDSFQENIDIIEKTNSDINKRLNINFIAKGYLPGRADSPLCLTTERYKNLHARLQKSGTRGLEMMKGTASIHLHAAICSIDEIPDLFICSRELSQSEDFKMQPERRDIWNNTDLCRCVMPNTSINKNSTPRFLIEEFIRYAFDAVEINKNIPFKDLESQSFDSLIYHMTTIFTDVRLNMIVPSIELRTLDTIPLKAFEPKWKKFTTIMDNI